MLEKKTIDARPFGEIWGQMTDLERSGLRRKLSTSGVSDDTLLNWRNGKTTPKKPYRDLAVRALRSGGYNVLPETLFPA